MHISFLEYRVDFDVHRSGRHCALSHIFERESLGEFRSAQRCERRRGEKTVR